MILAQLKTVDPGLTPQEICEAADLNWEVVKAPRAFYYQNKLHEVRDSYSLVNTQTGEEIDICSDRWKPLQNLDLITKAHKAVESVGLRINHAGSFRNGKAIALSVSLGEQRTIGSSSVGDVVSFHAFIIGSHEVGFGHQVRLHAERLVCTNGMTRPVRKGCQVFSHTSESVEVLAKTIANLPEHVNEYQERATSLTRVSISHEEARLILIKEFGNPKLSIQEQPQMVRTVLNLFDGEGEGSDMLTSFQTAWGLLNGLTEYYSHGRHTKTKDRLNAYLTGKAGAHIQRLESCLLGYGERKQKQQSQLAQPVTVFSH